MGDTCVHEDCNGVELAINRPRIFPSLCDWLDNEVPIEWLADFLKLVYETPNLDWLLLTKRPENFYQRVKDALWKIEGLEPDDEGDSEDLPATELNDWLAEEPPKNVWIGTSVEDQTRADERREHFKAIPAVVKFVSYEPALGDVNWRGWEFIDWLISGGESGSKARPFNIQWMRNANAFCREHGIAAFNKQLGRFPYSVYCPSDSNEKERVSMMLNDKKGGDVSEWPEDLRVREFPTVSV
jgi:protein gp37